MTISRDRALKALEAAKKNPSMFDDAEIDELIAAAKGNFGEGGSILGVEGPTGGEKLAEDIKPRGSMDDFMAARAKDPKLAQGFNLTQQPKLATTKTDEERDAETRAFEAAHFQPGDPEHGKTASGRRDLFAPPEHLPPAPEAPTGSMGPLDAFTASLDRARSNLPAYLPGGKVEYFTEPPLSQFHREMYPVLGDAVLKMGIGSPQYREYSDQLWKPIYEQAKAEGRSVVRLAFNAPKTLGEKASRLGAQVLGEGEAAAVGADEAAFGGYGTKLAARLKPGDTGENLENYKRMAETNPGARLAGGLVGGASQIGMGGLAGKAVGRLLPEARSALGAAARGAGMGAAAGMGTTTSEALSRDRLPTMGELGISGLFGAPFGALGGVHERSLKRTTPFGAISKADLGETNLATGIRKSSRANDITKASEAAGLEPGREPDYLAGQLEKPMVKAGRDLEAMTKKEIGEPQKIYFDMTKEYKKPTTPLVQEAMRLHEKVNPSSGELPFSGPERSVLREAIGKSSHAEIVPAPGGRPVTKAASSHAFDLDPDEAIRKGIDVDRLIQNGAPDDFVVRVTPRELNPEETENVIRLITNHVKDAKDSDALRSLHRASREVRDQFPAMGPIPKDASTSIDLGNGETLDLKGWSAWQHGAAEKVGDTQRKLGFAGLPESDVPARLTKNQTDTQGAAIRGFTEPGRHPDADAALREFAAMGGQGKTLNDLAGFKALNKMKGVVPTSRRDLLNAGRLRLDPLLRFYGPSAAGQVLFAPGIEQQQMPEALSDEELERKKREMGFGNIQGPFGPF